MAATLEVVVVELWTLWLHRGGAAAAVASEVAAAATPSKAPPAVAVEAVAEDAPAAREALAEIVMPSPLLQEHLLLLLQLPLLPLVV